MTPAYSEPKTSLPVAVWILGIAVIAVSLRLVGLDWDEGFQLHPDERFINMVQGAISWPSSLAGYFDTAHSTLNPHNVGHSFYVYGIAPVLLIRAVADLLRSSGVDPLLVARGLAALLDLGTVVLTGLLASLFTDRRGALFAAFLGACCVLQIQHAHFGVVDPFALFFSTAAVYQLCCIARGRGSLGLLVLLFGLTAGISAACKVPGAFVTPLLPVAIWLRTDSYRRAIALSAVAAILFLLTFRVAQPYAFAGPSFFSFALNPKWIANLTELSRLMQPGVGFPPAVQWMERDLFFPIRNMIFWGLGPLTALAVCLGILVAWQRRSEGIVLLLLWIGIAGTHAFFVSPSPVLRYQLPFYPALLVFGGVALAASPGLVRGCWAVAILLWGYGFTAIYREPHPRVAASHWIVDNIPGGIAAEVYRDNRPAFAQFSMQAPVTVEAGGGERRIPLFGPRPVESDLFLLHLGASSRGGALDGISVAFLGSDGVELTGSLTRWEGYLRVVLPQSVRIEGRGREALRVRNAEGAPLLIEPPRFVVETSWDDWVPLRVNGMDPLGGVYKGEEPLEVYWSEDQNKAERIHRLLNSAQYLLITSQRQWGSVGRLPQHFPLVQRFYRALGDCPEELSVPQCFAAMSGSTEQPGSLGFRRIYTAASYPRPFGFALNDELAEESFSVYDHPKVTIWRRERPEIRIP